MGRSRQGSKLIQQCPARWLAALTAVAATLASGVGTAQTLEEPAIEEVVVTATGQSSAMSTAKSSTPIIEAAQAISIISNAELDLRPSGSLTDALAYTAGVQSATLGVDSRVDNITVRGFTAGGFSSNNNFVDGLRLPAGGQFTRMSFDNYALEQIEVMKGPSGALYGQTAPGGLVNLVSKRPTDRWRAEVMAQGVGYFDLDRWNGQISADVGGALGSTVSGRLVGLARKGDTQVDDVENERYYVSPSITWKPGENTTWTVLGQYQRDEGGATFQLLPTLGVLTPSNGRLMDNGTFIGEPDYNAYDRDQKVVASFFEHRFNERFAIRNNTRYTTLQTYTEGVAVLGETLTTCPPTIADCVPGQTINRRGVQSDGGADGWATDLQLETQLVHGATSHTLLSGVDYFRTEYEFLRNSVAAALVLPLLDIFDPVYQGSSGWNNALSPLISTVGEGDQWGVYLQDQISVGRLRVTVGGRQDWTGDDTLNRVNGRRFVNENDEFTWRAGAVYLFDNGIAPYASFAESFQPQVSDPSTSRNGEPFVPTTGQQYEAGFRYQPGNNTYLTLGVYQITQQNITTPDPGGALCGTAICLVQTGEGRIRGVEFESKATLPRGMTLIGTLTRTDSEVTESNATAVVSGATRPILGNALPQVPKWMGSLLVSQLIRSGRLAGFGFGGGVRYVGESFGDAANAYGIPSFTLLDLFLRYDPQTTNASRTGVSFSLYGRNMADERYLATCSGPGGCTFGEGRSLTARVQFRW